MNKPKSLSKDNLQKKPKKKALPKATKEIIDKYDISSPVKYVVSIAWEKRFHITNHFAECLVERLLKNDNSLNICAMDPEKLWAQIVSIAE